MAASALAAGVTQAVGLGPVGPDGVPTDAEQALGTYGANLADGLIAAGAQLVTHQDGHLETQNVLTNAFGEVIGNDLVDYQGQQALQQQAQAQTFRNILNSATPDESLPSVMFPSVSAGSGLVDTTPMQYISAPATDQMVDAPGYETAGTTEGWTTNDPAYASPYSNLPFGPAQYRNYVPSALNMTAQGGFDLTGYAANMYQEVNAVYQSDLSLSVVMSTAGFPSDASWQSVQPSITHSSFVTQSGVALPMASSMAPSVPEFGIDNNGATTGISYLPTVNVSGMGLLQSVPMNMTVGPYSIFAGTSLSGVPQLYTAYNGNTNSTDFVIGQNSLGSFVNNVNAYAGLPTFYSPSSPEWVQDLFSGVMTNQPGSITAATKAWLRNLCKSPAQCG